MGMNGLRHSAEARAKMSASQRGNKNALGYKHTPESRARLAAARRGHGHPHTPEARAKIGAAQSGAKHYNWKGGRVRESQGYVRVLSPSHPGHDGQGYVLEHRLVMEAHLGRTLLPTEVVHHINGIKDDNRIENLERFDSNAEHQRRGIHKEKTDA